MDKPPLPSELGLLIALVLLFVSALLSAAEVALVKAGVANLTARAEDGSDRASRALALRARLNDHLVTLQVGVALVSVGFGIAIALSLPAFVTEASNAWMLAESYRAVVTLFATVLALVLYLIFSLQLPRMLSAANPEIWLLRLLPLVRASSWLLMPVALLMRTSSRRLAVKLGLSANDWGSERGHDEAELQLLLSAAEAGGQLDAVEQDLASRSLALGDVKLEELMIPRVNILALAEDMDLEQAREAAIEAESHWLPVHLGNADQINGIVEWRDLFRVQPGRRWQSYIRPVPFMPAGASASAALARLRLEKSEILVVLDEYGGTAGLVDVRDLYDELARAEWLPRHGAVINGQLPLRVVTQALQLDLDSGGSVTVSGYVVSQLGRFARPGDVVSINGWQLKVIAVDERVGVVNKVKLLMVPTA